MNDILHNTIPLWDYLATATKPIVLFGMGDGAEKILAICEEKKLPIQAVFASDGYARNTVFRGFTVQDYSTTKARLGDMIVLMAFGSQSKEVFGVVDKIRSEQEFYAPDVPVAGDILFSPDYFKENLAKFQQVYDLLADAHSKKAYRGLLQYKISGDFAYLRGIATPREEIFTSILTLDENEIFVDAGAYNGDTIAEFVGLVKGKYHGIFALEPSEKNYKKLLRNTQGLKNIKAVQVGAWRHKDFLYFDQKSGRGNALHTGEKPNTPVDSIDNLTEGFPVSYISYDVEGAEKEALAGSAKTIQAHLPKLLISLYHRSEDYFAIPLQLLEISPEYELYIRHNPYIPAWDTHLLAIPKEDFNER